MPFLLRVELPDVPGSLGQVASAIGEAGGDIGAIEIVEHRGDAVAVDDIMLDIAPGVMPDTVVSACNSLENVKVLWISRYAAGGNLFLDLEAVEELTVAGGSAPDRLVELVPRVFRVDWAVRLRRPSAEGEHLAEPVFATVSAPEELDWVDLEQPERLSQGDPETLVAGVPLGPDEILVMARRGGPEFLDSELARLGHLATLAVSIAAL